jgi:outer membrane murein-binding lipoprotein Lpp
MKSLSLIVTLSLALTGLSQDALPSPAEMWKIIQQQSKQIEELQAQVQSLTGSVDETNAKVEAVADVAEAASAGAGALSRISSNTTLGGYGELHLNKLNDQNGSSDTDQIDYHRFVLFIGHEFSPGLRFFSELEVEHSLAGEGKPGEVELEQAYVEMDLNASHRAKAGLFLVPVGILNETHEPPTFYGAERNAVEKEIIPSTWWESGLALSGQLTETLSYDFAYTSGLKTDGSFDIRKGRQKSAEAVAKDGAWTGRLKFSQSGLQLAGTLHYQEDLLQSTAGDDAPALLAELHGIYEAGPFSLRALWAQWDIDNDTAESIDADKQRGWYIEPGYKITNNLGLFARYSEWDEKAGGNSSDSEYSQLDVGVSFWPHENVVLKLDYQTQDAPDGKTELDGFNFGVGYHF